MDLYGIVRTELGADAWFARSILNEMLKHPAGTMGCADALGARTFGVLAKHGIVRERRRADGSSLFDIHDRANHIRAAAMHSTFRDLA